MNNGVGSKLVIEGHGSVSFDKKDVRELIEALWEAGLETLVLRAIDDQSEESHSGRQRSPQRR